MALLIEAVLGFVLSFVVLTVATYFAGVALGADTSIGHSAVTAALTSLVWFGVTYFVSGVVGLSGFTVALGPLLAAIAYFVVVDFRYSGGLGQAAGISVGTWVVTFAVLYVAAVMGYSSFQLVGVPPGIV